MKNFAFLFLFFLAFSCKNETSSTTSSASETAQDEAPKAGADEAVHGMEGAEAARIAAGEDATEYVYQQYKVRTVADGRNAGEHITVYTPDGQEIWKLANDSGHFFHGISRDHAFVDIGTGPSGRNLMVYDLKNNKTVFKLQYIGEASISADGVLSFYRNMPERGVPKSTRCPEKSAWEKDGLGIGYGQLHTYPLTDGEVLGKPVFKCFPVQ